MKIGQGPWRKISGIYRNIELFLKGKTRELSPRDGGPRGTRSMVDRGR
jgi:hypothetical protein